MQKTKTFTNFDVLQAVRNFATIMGQPLDVKFKYNDILEKLRADLISEEYQEVLTAVDPEDILKELGDLVYVVYGYAATYGWDLDEAVRRIHESNLSKLGSDGRPIRREDGKVLKSENYQPPNLKDLINE